jgi:hypothetical protein
MLTPTFNRLTESDDFKHWLTTPHSQLWLHGIPGAGKTILASSVIEETLKMGDKDNAVAFYYCDYKNEASHDPLNVLGSLASHIARQDNQFFDILQNYYKECNPDDSISRPAEILRLQNLISEMTEQLSNLAIIVDGLDECGQSTATVVNLLVELGNKDNVKTLFLSRAEQHIKDLLESYPQISIAARSSDLKLYVASEMDTRTRKKQLRLKSNELKEHIMDKLVNGADGM